MVHGPLKESLLRVLHNEDNDPSYEGLPKDPTELFTELSTTHKPTIARLVKKKLLNPDQLELLLPTDGSNKTFSSSFDITLISLMIINFTTLPAPKGGWRTPDASDNGVSANVVRGREWRNFVNHNNADTITIDILNTKWSEGIAIVKALGGSVKDMNSLKFMSLDATNNVVLATLNTYITVIETKLKNDIDPTLKKQIQAVMDIQKTLNTVVPKLQTVVCELNQVKTTNAEIEGRVEKLENKFGTFLYFYHHYKFL